MIPYKTDDKKMEYAVDAKLYFRMGEFDDEDFIREKIDDLFFEVMQLRERLGIEDFLIGYQLFDGEVRDA